MLCLGLVSASPRTWAQGEGAAPAPASLGAKEVADVLGGLRITIFGDVVGRRDDEPLVDDEGNRIDDRVWLRELGLLLTAPIGDFARGVAFGRWSEPAPAVADSDGFESEIDEAFIEFDPLPLPWEGLSKRLALRVGRFRAPFGRANRWRTHELPWITRPLAIRRSLGENGWVQTGLALTLEVPLPSERLALRLTTEIDRDLPLDQALTPLLNFDGAWHVSERDTLRFGVSTDSSRRERDFGFQSSLWGLDALYEHRARDETAAGTFRLGGEFLRSEVDHGGGSSAPTGAYLWGQLEFLPDWFVGGRYDLAEEIEDDSLDTRVAGFTLGWAAHPQLRVALGYEHTESDVPALDGADTVLAEVTFVFGSPVPGPFWTRPPER